MKSIVQIVSACLIGYAAFAVDSATAPVFQMRLVVDGASRNSEPMKLIRKDKDGVAPTLLYNVQKEVLLDETAIKSAQPGKDPLGQPVIELSLTDAGSKRFAEITRQNLHKSLAIMIAGKLYSTPRIEMEISTTKLPISGRFTEKETKELSVKINDSLKKH